MKGQRWNPPTQITIGNIKSSVNLPSALVFIRRIDSLYIFCSNFISVEFYIVMQWCLNCYTGTMNTYFPASVKWRFLSVITRISTVILLYQNKYILSCASAVYMMKVMFTLSNWLYNVWRCILWRPYLQLWNHTFFSHPSCRDKEERIFWWTTQAVSWCTQNSELSTCIYKVKTRSFLHYITWNNDFIVNLSTAIEKLPDKNSKEKVKKKYLRLMNKVF